jgi:putative hydrolase of the HAD superfamily
VRHVLFDADGVLQELPGGWHTSMEPFLGERTHEFLLQTWSDELPTLRGEGDYLVLLETLLRRYDERLDVEQVYDAVWRNITVHEQSVQLVQTVRAAGYGVHLGTNQEQHRARHMRTALGYDDLFDVSCYSYDLGVAKPDPTFFVVAAERIGDDPAAIVFVDDSERNVAGAREAGMQAVHWDVTQGHDVLVAMLAAQGVVCR